MLNYTKSMTQTYTKDENNLIHTTSENNLTHTNGWKNKEPNSHKLEIILLKTNKNITKHLTTEQNFKKHEYCDLSLAVMANDNPLLE